LILLAALISFLPTKKAVPGEAAFTLCLFSNSNEFVHEFKNIKEVPELTAETYKVGGGTALLDALGTTIEQIGQRLSAMPEEERPSKVIVLVITDGQENSSRPIPYSKAKIKEMISHQEEKYNWSFIFMGANIDSVQEGGAIGISANNAINYSASAAGTASVYANVSRGLARARKVGAAFTANDALFDADELKAISESAIIGTIDPVPADVK
jgi:hypothetical protein